MIIIDEPLSKHAAVRAVGQIVSTLGLFFYTGYFYAALLRDVVLRRFSSEMHRRRYLAHMACRKYIWRLARNKEDESLASDWDLLAARLVRSCMDIKGLIALCGLIGTVIWWLFKFIEWVLPTPRL